MSQYKGVLLDIDGTLLDSNDAHAQAWVEVLAENGYQADFEKIRSLIGKGGDKLLPEVTGLEKDTPEGKAISEKRTKIFMEKYLPNLKPLPGAQDLLKRMREAGLKLVVATSAKNEELKPMLDIIGATSLIQEETTSSDAKNSKPDPDIIQAALDKSGLEPAEVLMLGDTPYDIEAAGKARVQTIALRSGGWKDDDLCEALCIYNDAADLLAHYASSPLGS